MDVVYRGRDVDKRQSTLTVRSLAGRTVRDLPGTERANQPFFSPDGRWVGFFTGSGELKKVSLDGGNPLTLVEGINGSTWTVGTWTDDDEIIFGHVGPLRRVSAEGGSPEEVTTVEAEQRERTHAAPHHVSGTPVVLFHVGLEGVGQPRIESVNLDTGERQIIVENAPMRFVQTVLVLASMGRYLSLRSRAAARSRMCLQRKVSRQRSGSSAATGRSRRSARR